MIKPCILEMALSGQRTRPGIAAVCSKYKLTERRRLQIVIACIPSDGVTLMGFDTLLQISLVIEILIFQTSVHLSNSPFLLTMWNV